MSDLYFPKLDYQTLKNLDLVRQLMSEHVSYFLDSPYSGEEQRLLTSWFSPQAVKRRQAQAQDKADEEGARTHTLESNKAAYLYQETTIIYEGLKNAKYAQGMEGDEMSYYRTMASLMDKMISYQERAMNMKSISDGYATILGIMQNVLSEDQRQKVMEQLRVALHGE